LSLAVVVVLIETLRMCGAAAGQACCVYRGDRFTADDAAELGFDQLATLATADGPAY
jgi:hypothetical protein